MLSHLSLVLIFQTFIELIASIFINAVFTSCFCCAVNAKPPIFWSATLIVTQVRRSLVVDALDQLIVLANFLVHATFLSASLIISEFSETRFWSVDNHSESLGTLSNSFINFVLSSTLPPSTFFRASAIA